MENYFWKLEICAKGFAWKVFFREKYLRNSFVPHDENVWHRYARIEERETGKLTLEFKWKSRNEHENCMLQIQSLSVRVAKCDSFCWPESFLLLTPCHSFKLTTIQFVVCSISDDCAKAVVLATGFCLVRCHFCRHVTVWCMPFFYTIDFPNSWW